MKRDEGERRGKKERENRGNEAGSSAPSKVEKTRTPPPIFRDLETVPTALGSYLKESLMDGCLCIHS